MKAFFIFAYISICLSQAHCRVADLLGVNVAVKWNTATLQGIRDDKLGAPMVARALAVLHACMLDAWAAYDERAVRTQLSGALRRPGWERTLANKEEAISYAAYRALVDVLPVDMNSVYWPLMRDFGYESTCLLLCGKIRPCKWSCITFTSRDE